MTITTDLLLSHGWELHSGWAVLKTPTRLGWQDGRLVVGWFDYPEKVWEVEMLNDILAALGYEKSRISRHGLQ